MKGTFKTSEVVNLLLLRVPRSERPQFRIQNFLLGLTDWETSNCASLHIGEQGELEKLRKLLGDTRTKKIAQLYEKYNDAALEKGFRTLFPNKSIESAFFSEMEKIVSKKKTVTFCSRCGIRSTCPCKG